MSFRIRNILPYAHHRSFEELLLQYTDIQDTESMLTGPADYVLRLPY